MKRPVPLLALIAFLGVACSESPTETGVVNAQDAPLFKKGGKPKPSDPGVALEIKLGGGAFAGDGSVVYDETMDDGAATHLSGVNGNLMFDLRESARSVLVTADGFNDDLPKLVKTRIFTNNGPDPDAGLETGSNGEAVLEAEWRDGDFFYSLRYGKDCSGKVTGPKAAVTFDGLSSWTIIGASGLLCGKKQKGKPVLEEFGSAGAFVMDFKK